jgi:replicative DNA helicase
MVGEQDRPLLAERLRVWQGPLPFLLTDTGASLAAFVKNHGCGTVILDSLKDLGVDLSKDESGSRVNLAIQAALAAEIEVCVVHHQRKASGDNKRPDKLADVYGSTWLTSGCGSVLLLWGEPGDPIVELRHLKQPVEEFGPFSVIHDHVRGLPQLHDPPDLEFLLRSRASLGLTAADAAVELFGVGAASKNQIEKARRRLKKLEGEGIAVPIPDPVTGADRYVFNGGSELCA